MSWNPIYILLLIFSTVIDYIFCLNLTSSNVKIKRKIGLLLSVLINLSLLIFFKYFSFLLEIANNIFNFIGFSYKFNSIHLILPIGISFYTFQTISYSIDVYRKKILPERHLGKFALFVSFFPQLIAGPIERAGDLIPQIYQKKTKLIENDFFDGIILFLWGLFKKIVVRTMYLF